MSKDQIRIQLTPEQKAQVLKVTGKDAEAVELSVEELEERIAPQPFHPRGWTSLTSSFSDDRARQQ